MPWSTLLCCYSVWVCVWVCVCVCVCACMCMCCCFLQLNFLMQCLRPTSLLCFHLFQSSSSSSEIFWCSALGPPVYNVFVFFILLPLLHPLLQFFSLNLFSVYWIAQYAWQYVHRIQLPENAWMPIICHVLEDAHMCPLSAGKRSTIRLWPTTASDCGPQYLTVAYNTWLWPTTSDCGLQQ